MRSIILIYTLLLSLMLPALAGAISISVSPNPAVVNQQVRAAINASFPVGVSGPCGLQVNFGDGSGWRPAGSCDFVTSCTRVVNYTYAVAGTYQVSARSNPNPAICAVPPTGPDPASTSIQIIFTAGSGLPSGIVGIRYQHQLTVTGATGSVTYRLISGQLPAGIMLSPRGLLSGVPTTAGEYPFILKISDQSGQSIDQEYILTVEQAVLDVIVDPGRSVTERNRAGTVDLTYRFTTSAPLDDTIRSTQGKFYDGSRLLGTVNTTVTASLQRGSGQITERLVVPLPVVQAAERLGLSEVRYERIFTATFLEAQTASSVVIPVGVGFTITEIRVYFDNGQGKTTVKRNERKIDAFVDIRYEGAGTLEGYWEVDGRILIPVLKKLSYARSRVITLDLAGNEKRMGRGATGPPLPTYSLGSHRLRFVITQPAVPNIRFPEAIYLVTGEGLAESNPIILLQPTENARLNRGELQFSWQPKRGVVTYLVEFFEDKDEAPIFSAYTKQETYTIPQTELEKHFDSRGDYFLMVTGKDSEGEAVAQSKAMSFTVFKGEKN
jgi:hypothetical protein